MTFQLADFVFGGLRDLPGPVWISSRAPENMYTRSIRSSESALALSNDGLQRGYLLRRDKK